MTITTQIARQYSSEQIQDDKERVRCYRGDKRKEIIQRRILDDGLQDCTISRERKRKKEEQQQKPYCQQIKRRKRKTSQDVGINKRSDGFGYPSDII
jgi:hypothetical protein